MKKIILAITFAAGMIPPTCAQQTQVADSIFQAWNKPYASAEEIVKQYEAHQPATVINDCCMVWQAANYILQGKGQQQDINLLLSSFPTIDLTNQEVIAFMQQRKKLKIKDFIGHYYLLKGLKKGYTFDEARDGIFFTVYFPFRAPSQNDYEKMTDIFNTTNATLQEPFLKNLDFLMMNHGCTDGLESIRPLIEKNVAEGPLKQKALQLYAQYEPLRRGKTAPHSVLTDMKGKKHTFADFKGKTIVVDVWATWCGSCLEKMPIFESLKNKFAKHKDVIFVLLSTDRNKAIDTWKKNMKQYEQSGMKILRADVEGGSSFETDYNIFGLPRYMIIDRAGNIYEAFAPTPDKGLDKLIEEAIK